MVHALAGFETQKTIQKPITLYGTGVHSGNAAVLTFRPAAPNQGISFIRDDVAAGNNRVPVRWDRVVDTRMCTTIANEAGVHVATIEHMMAALYACAVTNVEIVLNTAEVPIMDGSAQCFVEALLGAGIADQNVPQPYLKVLRPIQVQEGERCVTLMPAELSSYECVQDFAPRADLAQQIYQCTGDSKTVRQHIMAARTFGYADDLDILQAKGFAMGASLQNSVAIKNNNFMNPEGLRYAEECARHKILDAIGDLYTIGMPILGQFRGVQSGHTMVHKLLVALFAQEDAWEIIGSAAEYWMPVAINMPASQPRAVAV